MAKTNKSEKIPVEMSGIYSELISLTNKFSEQYLNEEYAQLARYAAAALCRKKPSPIAAGKLNSWACGIIHAIGINNFLQDKSSKPYISSADLYQAFGVAESTGQGKSKSIRNILKMRQFDHTWCLPSRMDDGIFWIIEVNGLMIDARKLPIQIQMAAFNKGLIPYVPALKELEEQGSKIIATKLD